MANIDVSKAHVVCVVSNPVRWGSRIKLYNNFKEHMLATGAQLTTVECVFGERQFELNDDKRVNHVPVRAKTMLWTKENCINLGIQRLPQDWKYVFALDADIRFRQSNWLEASVHALQHYDVIQPWSECYDLGPHDEHIAVHTAFCKLAFERKPLLQGPNAGNSPYKFGHPGYGWGYTRSACEWAGGLIDTAILGAADHHMAMALVGRARDSIPGNLMGAYAQPILDWEQRVMRHINKNIGYVPGTIEHQWHGSKDKRFYVDRWKILSDNKFDPRTDIKRNIWGVYELTGNKPEMTNQIDRYFRCRDEDSNSMG